MGRLGWTEAVFYASTLRAFLLAIQARDKADQYREQNLSWMIRQHAYVVALGFAGKKLQGPHQLWPHEWDDKETTERIQETPEEARQRLEGIFRKWDELEANGRNS